MRTANQIKSEFETLASGHYQIHSFLYAQEFEQQAYENLIYPLMLVYPLGGGLQDTTYTRNYRVIIADRVLKSEGNELEVESDTQLICLDILAYWKKLGQNERFTISSSETITPFWEKWGDEVTGHFVDIGIEMFYDFNSCAIPMTGTNPSPINPCKDARILVNSVIYGNAPSDTNFNVLVKDQDGDLVGSLIGNEWIVNTGGSCDDASYTIEDSLGNVLYTGTIPSGGSLTQEISNSTLDVNRSDGVLISSRSILAEGSDSYNVADSIAVIKDSANNTLKTENILATISEDITINDSVAVIKDSLGTILRSENILAEASENITINDSTLNVNKSDGTLISSRTILAEGTTSYNVADSIAVIKNASGTTLFSENILATESENITIGNSTINNSDSSYSASLLAQGLLTLPDSQINLNGVSQGNVVSVKTININTNITPTSSSLTGNTLDLTISTTPTTGEFLVRFLDLDGTVLKEERRNAGQDATAPANPDYDPIYIEFDEWNQSFTNVQHDIDVGALYKTKDPNRTYLFLRITDTTGLQPQLFLNKTTAGTLSVDWGDGNSQTTTATGVITITKTAPYTAVGNYIVIIEYGNVYQSVQLLGNNTTYSSALLKIYCGNTFRVNPSGGSFSTHRCLEIISLNKNAGTPGNGSQGLFSGCNSLIHLTIPNEGGTNFSNFAPSCHSLRSISIPPTFTFYNGAFASCNSLENIVITGCDWFFTNPAFSNNTSLKRIVYPGTISTNPIHPNNNQNNYNLKEVIIRSGVITIGGGCFIDNFSLRTFTIQGSTLTTLGNVVFSGCRALEVLEFPSSLTTIGFNCFANCLSMLEYVFNSTTPPTLATAAFTGINAACKIYVPDANVATYKAATNWVTWTNYIYPLSTRP